MRRALFGLMAILVIALVAVLSVPLLISAEGARNSLFAQIEQATGYRLAVGGDVGISVFPFLDLVAEHVGVAERTDEGYREIVTAQSLRLGLSLTGLLTGTVRMSEITLVEPVITVPETGGAGADAGGADAAQAAQGAQADGPAGALRRLGIDRLTIENGTIVLPEAGGTATRIEGVQLAASLSSYDSPLIVDLKAVHAGAPVAAKGRIDTFGALVDGTATAPFEMELTAPAWLGQPLVVAGTASHVQETLRIERFTASAGQSVFGGSVAADLSGAVPVVKASLEGSLIDLDTLLPHGGADGAKADSGGSGGAGAGAGGAGAAGEAIDFSALSSVLAEVDVSLERLIASGIAVAPLVANVRVGDGRAEVVADLIGVGNATGSASASVDATQESPYVSGAVRISGVDLAEAGRIAGAALPLTGTAGADIRFATAGRTAAELKGRINASGSLSLQDGTAEVPGLAEALGDPAAGRLQAIAVEARFADLVQPLTLAGAATWRGERFDLSASAEPRGILAGGTSAVMVKAASGRVSGGFEGSVAGSGKADGRLSLSTPSLTGLLRWLGQEPGWQSGFEAFSVAGRLKASDAAISFEDASIRLDDTHGTGSGTVSLGARPRVEARLDLERLDVNPYLPATGQSAPAPAATPGGLGTPRWSDERIDFSALKTIDAKLSVSTKELVYRKIKAGPVALTANLKGGRLNVEFPDFGLYGGVGSGQLSVDTSGSDERPGVPVQAFRFYLSDLDAHPFLTDAAGFGRIEGTGAVKIDLKGSGDTQRAIVSSLTGEAEFEFTDGAIRGINIAKMVRSLTSATLSGWQSSEAEKTDFASLGATFAVKGGVARTDDLHLVGPFVRMTGSGAASLPQQSLEFRVDPKVVASLEGQGGQSDMQGLGVPVIVTGPWTAPRIYPDIAGILQDPQAAYNQLRNLGKGLFSLPDLGGSGGAGGIVGAIQQQTGVPVGDMVKDGKIDADAVQRGLYEHLQRVMGNQGGQPQATQPPGQPPAASQGTPPQAAQPQAEQPKGGQKQGGQNQTGQKKPKANDGQQATQPPAAPQQDQSQAPAKADGGNDQKPKKARKAEGGQNAAAPEAEPTPEDMARQLLQDMLQKQN